MASRYSSSRGARGIPLAEARGLHSFAGRFGFLQQRVAVARRAIEFGAHVLLRPDSVGVQEAAELAPLALDEDHAVAQAADLARVNDVIGLAAVNDDVSQTRLSHERVAVIL